MVKAIPPCGTFTAEGVGSEAGSKREGAERSKRYKRVIRKGEREREEKRRRGTERKGREERSKRREKLGFRRELREVREIRGLSNGEMEGER